MDIISIGLFFSAIIFLIVVLIIVAEAYSKNKKEIKFRVIGLSRTVSDLDKRLENLEQKIKEEGRNI